MRCVYVIAFWPRAFQTSRSGRGRASCTTTLSTSRFPTHGPIAQTSITTWAWLIPVPLRSAMLERAETVATLCQPHPNMTGGVGVESVRHFYAHHFIGVNPPDFELRPVS